jgi:pimeloyl-ACP methyl ester carboxylesterase
MASHTYPWKHGHVHYAKRGLGDPLVLIHNLYPGADHQEYAHNLAELGRHFTVYAPDLLGFGQSDAPRIKYTADTYVELIRDFLRDVVAEPAAVVSAGLPCAYVSEVAAADPALISKLIFICPRSEPTGLDTPRWFAPLKRLFLTTPPLGSGLYDTMAGDADVATFLRGCFDQSKHVTPELIARLTENARRPGTIHAFASLLTGYLDRSLLASLPQVHAPLLLIWGRHARPAPVEHGVRLVAVARHSRLRVIERAGAWPHHEQSAQANRLITDFLNDALPGADDVPPSPSPSSAQVS